MRRARRTAAAAALLLLAGCRDATEAFVASFLAIIGINLVLAKLLNTISYMFIEGGTQSAFG